MAEVQASNERRKLVLDRHGWQLVKLLWDMLEDEPLCLSGLL